MHWNRSPIALLLVLAALAAVFAPSAAHAQAAPDTDLVRLPIRMTDAGPQVTGPPTPLLVRPGYDNQPWLLDDGRVLHASIGADGQGDIFVLEPWSGWRTRWTASVEAEYSPTPIPSSSPFAGPDDASMPALSVIQVLRDGRQVLTRIAPDRRFVDAAPDILLPRADGAPGLREMPPIGYHAWDPTGRHLALFLLGTPPTLATVSFDADGAPVDNAPVERARGIGRTLRAIPGDPGGLSFVVLDDGLAGGTIQRLDWRTGAITPIAATLPDRQDYAWSSDGLLWMASEDGVVHWLRPPVADPALPTWRIAADLRGRDLGTPSRLAVDPSGGFVVLVVERAAD